MSLKPYTTIEGKRTNSVRYVVDDYCYRSAGAPSGNSHTLKCVLYKPKSATHCPVRATLVIDEDKVRVRYTHNHGKEDIEAHKLQRKVYAKVVHSNYYKHYLIWQTQLILCAVYIIYHGLNHGLLFSFFGSEK